MTDRLAPEKPLSIAILAMGGQGGGVLADWIVALGEQEGWVAQTTSVPGVAQRTGATIYYIEMLPEKDGRPPVLSLMPTPGDVDVVMAAELMEAGRSVLRGLVTPDRTTLIASTHRSFAVAEKERPGDGTADPQVVIDATDFAARQTIAFDMDRLAAAHGSVISSAMFGVLAASGRLPFPRAAFEQVIKAGGKGISASLKAFGAAYDRVGVKPRDEVAKSPEKSFAALPDRTGHQALDGLVARIRALPQGLHPMAFAGVKSLTDYQDAAYAGDYLDRLSALVDEDRRQGGEARGLAFSQAAAKYLAIAMGYDDVMRVADLKTRASRFARVRDEVGVGGDQILNVTEFMHPRAEEVCGSLPRALGSFIERRPKLFAILDRAVSKPRRVRTTSLGSFLTLYILGGWKRFRRGTLRHAREMAVLEDWIGTALTVLPRNYDLAVEIIKCRRLIKGYSHTHARGESKFARVMSAVPLLTGRDDGGPWLARLRQAALVDEDGRMLDGALRTVATL